MKILKKILKIIFFSIRSFRLIPHWILFNTHDNRNIIRADVKRWLSLLERHTYRIQAGFLYLMLNFRDFRNLYYNRIGSIQRFIKFLCPPTNMLYLQTKNIGEGFMIWHGFSTIIRADSIGKNCTIRQQITVGNEGNKGGGFPIIGDNVEIGAGAVVIGNIKIGNNVMIGANTVVTEDVPDNCTVVAPPAYIFNVPGRNPSP